MGVAVFGGGLAEEAVGDGLVNGFAQQGRWELVEVEKVTELVGPVGGVLNIPACVVSGEGGGAEWTVGVALCGEVWCDGTPSHVQLGGMHGHGGARVQVWVD